VSEQQPAEPEPGKPIPFKPSDITPLNADAPNNPQTSAADCNRVGGHGGKEGKRVYTANGKLICEICGAVDIA